jgi:tetratricopeptide (TPR) repeat protein
MLAAMKLEASKFHNVLKSLRVRRGMEWTQEKTAELLDVKVRLYRGWEYGEFIPSAEQLINIAVKFALSQEDADMLYRAAAQTPPKIRHLPFLRNPLFTGRTAQFDQIHQYLNESGSVALTQPVSISGLGGIGKTQLALEYAYRCYQNKVYRAVLWVDAADEATLEASYGDLVTPLGLPELDEQELAKRVQAVMQWLEDHTNWLLIMDNADNLQLARSFFPSCDHARILLTTRSQIVGNTIARKIELDKMEPAEGLLFLLRRSFPGKPLDETTLDTVAADIREAATQVVELLGGLPLALDHAGAYIEDTGVSFTEYRRRYDKARHDLLDRRSSQDEENKGKYSDHPDTVVVTFELCFRNASERHPLATDILNFCAFLQPDAIPTELFEHNDSFKYGTTAFDDGIAALQRYSLIRGNSQDQTFSLHRLVQAVATDAMPPDLQRQWRERVVRALDAAFPNELEFQNWRQCKRLLFHAWNCATWTDDELTPTVEAAELFRKAGSYLSERGRYTEAELLQELALLIYEQDLGTEHPTTARGLHNLAVLYKKQGKFSQAEPLYRQAIAIQMEKLGVGHPETLLSLQNLAALYMQQGKIARAEQLIKRVLILQDDQLGAEHPDTVMSLFLLATIWSVQGHLWQAEFLYRHVLKILEKSLGPEHPDLALPLLEFALLLHKQGKHAQADALYQRALRIHEQQFGATHPNVHIMRREYANFLHSIGRDAEAAALEVNDKRLV